MLAQAYILCQASLTVINFISHFNVFDSQPIAIFLTSADEMYGPITTLCHNNCVVKHIPWSAFKMTDNDWNWVIDAHNILGGCVIPSHCSSFNLASHCSFEKPLFFIWKAIVLHLDSNWHVTHYLGLKSHPAVLLFGETTHPLACPPCSRRTTNGMGEETWQPQICTL